MSTTAAAAAAAPTATTPAIGRRRRAGSIVRDDADDRMAPRPRSLVNAEPANTAPISTWHATCGRPTAGYFLIVLARL